MIDGAGFRAPFLAIDPDLRRLLVVTCLLSSCWGVHTFLVPVLGHERGYQASVIGSILGAFWHRRLPGLRQRLTRAQSNDRSQGGPVTPLACMDQDVWAATIDEYRRVAAARSPSTHFDGRQGPACRRGGGRQLKKGRFAELII